MKLSPVPFHRPWFGEEEEREVIETLRSGWLTTGDRTRRFEEAFCEYTAANYAVGLNSCTAGLFLSLKAFGIGPGDEVVTTPMTFTATANVIVHLGAQPVFADINPEDFNMNVDLVDDRITSKTRALLPVHYGGRPCDMDALLSLAEKHNLTLIEDAAHAVESEYKGRKIGNISDAACFSFYPNKNITTGEGGMVTTNNKEVSSRIRLLSNHGLNLSSWQRYKPKGQRQYEVTEPGYKFNMFDIQAAIGVHQLKKIEAFWRRRQEISHRYDASFSHLPQITLFKENPQNRYAYHIYVILINEDLLSVGRDEIIEAMIEAGIGVSVHFRALHLHEFYRKTYGFAPEDFPVASDISNRVISLPLYPRLKDKEVERVIDTVTSIMQKYSR